MAQITVTTEIPAIPERPRSWNAPEVLDVEYPIHEGEPPVRYRFTTAPEPEREPIIPESVCEEHGAFWPVFLVSDVGTCPACVERILRGGEVVLEDVEKAERDVAAMKERVGNFWRQQPPTAYAGPLRAARSRERVERAVEAMRAWEALEFHPFMTVQDVAALLKVSEDTVRREAGRSLPAPVTRVGRQWRFSAPAILNRIYGPLRWEERELVEDLIAASQEDAA